MRAIAEVDTRKWKRTGARKEGTKEERKSFA